MGNHLPEALRTFRHEFDIRVFIDKNKGDWHMPMEWHTSLEIFLCLNGSGKYYIGNKLYEFQEGDIFVISDNELHKSEIDKYGFFDALIIMFSPEKIIKDRTIDGIDLMNLFYGRIGEFYHKCSLTKEKQQMLQLIGSILLSEYEKKQEGYMESMKALLTCFLIELNREYKSIDSKNILYVSGKKLKHKKIISEVLSYIDENYMDDINLGDLSERLYVNQSYLSREFKKSTGYSMVKFITNKRMREARELLRSTDLLITEIAMRVGYNNITHFHTMFKKEIGISPKEFRKQIQNGENN